MGLVVGLEYRRICQGIKKTGRYPLARKVVKFLYAVLSIEAIKWWAKPSRSLPW